MENKILIDGKYKFKIVNAIPRGYKIWDITKCIQDKYLPLCKADNISKAADTNSLKVIKINGAQAILNAIGYGPVTVLEMQKYVNKYKNAKGKWARLKVFKMQQAIPYMQNLIWE